MTGFAPKIVLIIDSQPLSINHCLRLLLTLTLSLLLATVTMHNGTSDFCGLLGLCAGPPDQVIIRVIEVGEMHLSQQIKLHVKEMS